MIVADFRIINLEYITLPTKVHLLAEKGNKHTKESERDRIKRDAGWHSLQSQLQCGCQVLARNKKVQGYYGLYEV